jgi:tRNA (guanosine-2'-O-)-methyltransferase
LLADFDVAQKACIFFGSESEGISSEVMDQADRFIKIPMVGFTESLNISVSAAIILQHITAKLKQTDLNWQLTQEQKNEKKMDWIKKTIHSFDEIVERFYNDN